jgi:NTP pyrophosphatase (non-canonical NTP hydrolase)
MNQSPENMEKVQSIASEPLSNDKSLNGYQNKIKDVAESFKFGWSNYVQYAHLVEEVAELGEAITVHEGDRKAGSGEAALADHSDVKEEIGDIFFTLGQISNQLGVKLEDAMDSTFVRYQKKLEKLNKLQGPEISK